MFKLKYSDIKSREFVTALSKLMTYNGYKSTKIAYNIAKIARKFDQETKICQDLFLVLVKKYAVLDALGEIAPRMNGATPIPGTYVIQDSKVEEWQKASEEFDNTEIEIQCTQLKLEDLEGAQLTPMDLSFLEPLILHLEVAPLQVANGECKVKDIPATFPPLSPVPA